MLAVRWLFRKLSMSTTDVCVSGIIIVCEDEVVVAHKLSREELPPLVSSQ